MPIFDKHDEDDDFRGVDGRYREEITSIGSAIHESLVYGKFLLIFHNGGDAYFDLADCGIPQVGAFGKGILLWTNYGRFQFSREKQKLMTISTSIDMEIHGIDAYEYICQTMRPFVHNEFVQVIGYTGMDGINPATVLDCFLYLMFLTEQPRENSIIGVDYGWSAHACNYWVCDGIIGGDRAWEIGNALYEVIPLSGYSWNVTIFLEYLSDGPERLRKEQKEYLLDEQRKRQEGWCSVTSNKQAAEDISNVPDSSSSYFLTFQGDDPIYLHGDMFQLASNLRVLKLCNCSFNFSSPPFHCCQNLRFLWLDHCTNTEKKQGGGSFFPNLIVFDLRFTEYVLLPQIIESMTNLRELNTMGVSWKSICHAWEKLQKLNKLRVTESSDFITFDSCSCEHVNNLELLDLSSNTLMESLPTLSSARSLKMLVLDGCSILEQVALEGAPLLESFSFDGYGPVENWTHSIQLPQKELRLKTPIAPLEKAKVTKISLHGCVLLHDIFLLALPNLEELDLSCTAIKTLDLNAMDVPQLKKLFLMGCHQLRSLIWKGWNPSLTVLHIDTQLKARSITCTGEDTTFDFEARIAFTDGRFIWSAIEGLHSKTYNSYLPKVYLLISCMSYGQASITKGIQEISPNEDGMVPTGPLLTYSDIALAKDVTHSSLVWDRQQLQPSRTHIEIGEGSYNLESMQDDEVFRSFIDYHVESLYVHDNSSITAIPPTTPASWNYLKWCHVEKCPKLHTLFTCWMRHGSFEHITIFSASDLVMAYCIWGRSIDFNSRRTCFQQLQHIYLHNCPRLVFVLPISFHLPNLESIQIAYCSNIRHVFPYDEVPQEIASGVTFMNLKHIKLHHLHKLEQICEARLTAPVLETIGLRDCWGLRRLPAVASHGPKPVVDCEKDWWDKLEWDGLDAGHDPSLFQTRHSAYYKKTIPRGSVLR